MAAELTPPQEILSYLRELGTEPDGLDLSMSSDLSASGEYGKQWLIVSRGNLHIFDPTFGDRPLFEVRLSDIEAIRSASAVGAGLLQLKLDGVWVDLIRYSNRLKFEFETIAKSIEKLIRGESLSRHETELSDPQRCPKCGLMLEFPGELCPRCIRHSAALFRMLGQLRKYLAPAVWIGVLLAIGIALDMAWPLLTRYLVDYVLVASPPNDAHPVSFLAHVSPYQQLTYVVLALAGVHVVRAAISLVTGRLSSRVGNDLTFDIRAQLVRKLEHLGLGYYSKQDTGSLVGRVAYDTEAVQSLMSQITSGFFMQFMLVVISFVMMATMQPKLALCALVPAPAVLGGAVIYWRYVHPHFQRYWDRSSKQAGVLNGILSGIRVVKAFAQEPYEFSRFQRYSTEVRETKNRLDRTSAYFYPFMGIVFQVGGWLIWYVGGRNVLDHHISLGTLMAFFGYLSMFYGPLGSLTNLTTWLTQFSTQTYRIFEILDTPSELPEAESPIHPTEFRGEIEFRDVTFGYSRGMPVIKNFNLQIRAGERLGIVGRSGSGKTSLTNLLCRFYDPDSGQILVDGIDLRNLSVEALRSHIGIVLQEPFLFRGTLAENIRYGRPGASAEEVIQCAKAANAHDFTMRHPLGYDTSVGERGQELSGGERQRISIARAFLLSPSILVLDEATSSVDTESELAIQLALEHLAQDRTMIVIAHRLSTLQNCDRIILVDNGKIVESGTHRELMALDQTYASWVRIQQGQSYMELDETGQLARPSNGTARGIPTHLPPLRGFAPRWLRPELDIFERGPRRELHLRVAGEGLYRGIFALRCFPVHHPERYISLRHLNADNQIEEIGIIRDLRDWPTLTQNLIRESLRRRYFFHTIRAIRSIQKMSQFLTIRSATDLGDVEFLMRNSQDSAQDYGPRGKLLIDVEDNLYVIPDVARLPKDERDDFERYIFW